MNKSELVFIFLISLTRRSRKTAPRDESYFVLTRLYYIALQSILSVPIKSVLQESIFWRCDQINMANLSFELCNESRVYLKCHNHISLVISINEYGNNRVVLAAILIKQCGHWNEFIKYASIIISLSHKTKVRIGENFRHSHEIKHKFSSPENNFKQPKIHNSLPFLYTYCSTHPIYNCPV